MLLRRDSFGLGNSLGSQYSLPWMWYVTPAELVIRRVLIIPKFRVLRGVAGEGIDDRDMFVSDTGTAPRIFVLT